MARTAAPTATTTTIIKTEREKSFDTPKVNIPKYKGGLEEWHSFWGRFKPAVHDNAKISEPVKMAILLDLVEAPPLKQYLSSQSDGKEGRYGETIAYFQSRFDRPRELHQLYVKQLIDLPAIKGTPEDLSKAADSMFSAYQGIKRGGQSGIEHVATSIAVSILPPSLRMQWENKTESSRLVPSIEQLIEFCRQKATNAQQAQKISVTPSAPSPKEKKRPSRSEGRVYHSQGEPTNADDSSHKGSQGRHRSNKPSGQGQKLQCTLCSGSHFLFQCKLFLELAVPKRREHVQGASTCFNCLRVGHAAKDCQSTYKCRLCQKTHNTLLHIDSDPSTVSVNHVVGAQGSNRGASPPQQKERLLMTSQVLLTNVRGEQVVARAMLDSGAAISVLSSRMMAKLQLPKTDEWLSVTGVESQSNSPPRPTTNVTVSSMFHTGWSATVKAVILPKVATNLPVHDLSAIKQMPHLQGLTLADPLFHQPRNILDADVVDEVMLPERVTGPPSTPSAWQTRLGWGVTGRYLVPQTLPRGKAAVNVNAVVPVEEESLNATVERFWKIEELPQGKSVLPAQEVQVQNHFASTHYYHPPAGRYVVSLPKRTTSQELGESMQTAKSRFLRTEQSLLNKGKWASFQEVVQEYLTLGHAQKTSPSELCTPVGKHYYLPMHAVYKATSSSTKTRVVSDASCPTTTGVSLNDMLAAGPTLHPNLDHILIRYRVAVSADIAKMYREVLLSEQDKQYHRFLWRSQPDHPLATYHMNRVTFGVKSSPYLAVRALQQAATDFSSPDSIQFYHVTSSFYVDDLLAGADSVDEAVALYQSLRVLLLKAGFNLKKWRSSSEAVLSAIPTDLQEPLPEQQLVDEHAFAYPKTLGIAWDSRKDVMAAQVQLPANYVSTKRGIVSDTAKSFDVLGWLAPFMINMKVLFQHLWKCKVGWDDPIEDDLAQKHKEWREQLSVLKSLTLPRCYFTAGAPTSVQLHGFADASQSAYAAAVYLRVTYTDGSVSSRLVVAKTRVAPLKTVSIPRLELSAADMLAELLDVTKQALQMPELEIWAWCDSTVALGWLRASPSLFKTFVANRVATASHHVSPEAWLHVPTDANPADCASRGISALELRTHHFMVGWSYLAPSRPGGSPFTTRSCRS